MKPRFLIDAHVHLNNYRGTAAKLFRIDVEALEAGRVDTDGVAPPPAIPEG